VIQTMRAVHCSATSPNRTAIPRASIASIWAALTRCAENQSDPNPTSMNAKLAVARRFKWTAGK
jgi:hypothetical protein